MHRPLKGAALRAALEKRLDEIKARLNQGEWRWIQVPAARAEEAIAMFRGPAGAG